MPSRRPAFANATGLATWRENHCRACFEPAEAALRLRDEGVGCPLIVKARRGVAVPEWKLKPNALTSELYVCEARVKTPASTRRVTAADETLSMFDLEPEARVIVPVDTWPDRPPPVDLDAAHQ